MASFLTAAQQTRRAFLRRVRWYAIIGGVLLLAIGAGGLVVQSPIFKSTELVFEGVPSGAQESVVRDLKTDILQIHRSAILGTDHYFSWPSKLSYSAAAASAVNIKKDLFSKTITFNIVPRQRYAVWCQATTNEAEDSCFWIDNLGIAFDIAPVAQGQLVRTIFATSDAEPPVIGRAVTSAETFGIIKKIIDAVLEMNIAVDTTTYDGARSELRLTTNTGTIVRLSTRFDPEATALPALKRLAGKPGLNNFEYVNLTVENRAFLKPR
jgi:hypothetical protein